MTQLGRRFGLSNEPGNGVWCGETGVFVGAVPLLERRFGKGPSGCDEWQARRLPEINQDLSERYGLPIEFGGKAGGLQAVARALSRGDLLHAQIATLIWRFLIRPCSGNHNAATKSLIWPVNCTRAAYSRKIGTQRSIRGGRREARTVSVADLPLPALSPKIPPLQHRARRSFQHKSQFRFHLNFPVESQFLRKFCLHQPSQTSIPVVI